MKELDKKVIIEKLSLNWNMKKDFLHVLEISMIFWEHIYIQTYIYTHTYTIYKCESAYILYASCMWACNTCSKWIAMCNF